MKHREGVSDESSPLKKGARSRADEEKLRLLHRTSGSLVSADDVRCDVATKLAPRLALTALSRLDERPSGLSLLDAVAQIRRH